MTNENQMNEDLDRAGKNISKWLDPIEIIRLENQKFSQNDIKLRANASESFYIGYFERTLKLITLQVLRDMGAKAGPDGVLAYKGSLYFADLMKEWFENQVRVSKSYRQPKPKPSKPGEVIAPVEED